MGNGMGRARRQGVRSVWMFGAALAAAGCASTPDRNAGELSMTTASVEALHAASPAPAPSRAIRDETFTVSPKSGAVSHSPVYFRSDSESTTFDAGDLAISGEDLTAWIPEAARFFVSIAWHPIDLVFTPPGTRMVSDAGRGGDDEPAPRTEDDSG